MTATIELDDDVFEALKLHAEPFVDTPSDVVRRLLSLAEGSGIRRPAAARPADEAVAQDVATSARRTRAKQPKRKRAPSDALLPQEAYELPILRVLDDAGGRLPTSEAVAAVGRTVDEKLMPMDRDTLDSGKLRWEMRVVFTRLRLVKAGLLKDDSPRGTWEISDAGRKHLEQMAVAA